MIFQCIWLFLQLQLIKDKPLVVFMKGEPDAPMVSVRYVTLAPMTLVWFPDPSVMRMRGRGKKGLGNNYTLARARGWNLKKVLEFISSRCNTNFCPQVVLATCTIRLPACQYS